ncbi:hypothetical protein EG830_02510 [bacterium]|nr:hypothetical protein [bacterium]
MNTFSAFSLPPIPNPETSLINACRQGDQRAQLQIYKLCYKVIFNICLMVVPDQAKAEEIMHEVILASLEEIRESTVNPGFSELIWRTLDRTLAAQPVNALSSGSKNREN